MVWSQQVALQVGRPVEDADIVLGAGLVGTWQLGDKEDIKGSLPWPESDGVPVTRLVGLLKNKGVQVSWQLKRMYEFMISYYQVDLSPDSCHRGGSENQSTRPHPGRSSE